MPSPIVGLIGCGTIGRFHSRNVRAVSRSELVPVRYAALADRLPERSAAFAEITGANAVSGAREVMEHPGVNAVYVCAETSEHPALVAEAAARGLHVFCEKPLARTLDEARQMSETVEAAGIVHQVGLVLRTSPIYTVLRSMMEDEALGTLLTAHLRDDQFFPISGHYNSEWRSKFDKAGGGTLIEHSIHDIDLFRWLFGEVEAVRCHTRNIAGYDRIEDVALVTFQHEGGHATTLSSVWHNVSRRPSTRRIEVFFQRGWFALDDDFIGPIHRQLDDGPVETISAEDVVATYARLLNLSEAETGIATLGAFADYNFLRSVLDGRPAEPSFRTALRAHEIVDACYRSASDGVEIATNPQP